MTDKHIEEALFRIFDIIASEDSDLSEKKITDVIENLAALKDNIYLHNPEEFNLFIVCKLEKILSIIAKSFYENPIDTILDKNKPNFIFKKYGFLKNNISKLCEERTGSVCSSDKARYIINMYLEYSLTGVIPKDDFLEEHYWIPKFGCNSEWIDFCDGLYQMYYGNPRHYFSSYKVLIESEIRLFKHVLHNWYIRLVNGDVIKLMETWDDSDTNPLYSDIYDKGDYYLIKKSCFKETTYTCADDTDMILKRFYKVPKTDILDIYKISEEKFI